jgi:hypothetical protein
MTIENEGDTRELGIGGGKGSMDNEPFISW